MLTSVWTLFQWFLYISISSLVPIYEDIHCLFIRKIYPFSFGSLVLTMVTSPVGPLTSCRRSPSPCFFSMLLLLLPFYYACSFFIAFRCLIVACIIFAWLISNSIQIEGEAERDERISQQDHGMSFSRARFCFYFYFSFSSTTSPSLTSPASSLYSLLSAFRLPFFEQVPNCIFRP